MCPQHVTVSNRGVARLGQGWYNRPDYEAWQTGPGRKTQTRMPPDHPIVRPWPRAEDPAASEIAEEKS